MREKIFVKEIGNIRKIGSMGYVISLIFEIVRNVNGNNRGSIVEGDICKNPQEYTLEINTILYTVEPFSSYLMRRHLRYVKYQSHARTSQNESTVAITIPLLY